MSRYSRQNPEEPIRHDWTAGGRRRKEQGSLAAPAGSASILELGHAKSNDAHCLACGFRMIGGANVGLCPKCGSDRWYKTRL